MSVTQPPTDAPFGLQPNVAAGLAYLLAILGGIIMLVGGGTNKFVKFAAAQSITFWVSYIVVWIALDIIVVITHMYFLGLLFLLLWLVSIGVWLWTTITAFQGKEVRLPVVGDLTQNIFKSML
ncbi:MAG: DUF4870 domain-containing protein [Candidatus Eremiobacteraeota bacterium]|nr:DUF4870 domain-containing protein [Candidatus Eremiobacteraeota bacterium]MBV8333802.1 DUF4870 domain-containing protein [Candidatus Eremiobacteraeota bacterium]MBV8435698.1 DUF4870 domain-containing protein [Candidatus Eremiobacteraeota bacterium]MBV8654448.1 DUF4870 domain-containing protein [Candidatus Eremiobacteraeota bacterium]